MTTKNIAIIAALVVATIPVALVLRSRLAPSPAQPLTQEQAQEENQQQVAAQQQATQDIQAAETAPPPVTGMAELKAFAAAFVEQFGSYSNQTSFSNITSLKPQMTASFAFWADGYVRDQQALYPASSVYAGVTTRVLSTTITGYAAGGSVAAATVKTQREKVNGSTREVAYQTMELALVKDNGQWKVDSATWK